MELENYILQIPEKYRNRIIIHSHFELIKKYNLKGLHFNKRTIHLYDKFVSIEKNMLLKSSDPSKRVGTLKELHTSYSAHSLIELKEKSEKFDYVFISPIFDSISKPDYKSNFNLQTINKYITKNNIKNAVALGGINFNNIQKLKEINFFGAAMLGAIW